jgi:hypothetical protein
MYRVTGGVADMESKSAKDLVPTVSTIGPGTARKPSKTPGGGTGPS